MLDDQRISELTLCLAHDLKSPIAAIISNTHYVLEEDQNPETSGALKDILGATDFLVRMLQDLEAIALHARGKLEVRRERVALQELLSAVRTDARDAAMLRDHRLEIRVSPANALASIDRDIITRVLRNLVDNSIAYSPPRTEIGIFASMAADRTLELVVKDHGPRVPPAHMHQLFSRFGRLERDRVGRIGRGASMHFCQVAAEVHGGTIAISDEDPEGVVFRMTLPDAQYS